MAPSEHAGGDYRALRPDLPEVAFAAQACLPARSPLSKCRECADACPVDALDARKGRLSLSDNCLRCGRCAAACPTGALRVSGFPQVEESVPEPLDQPLTVDCWRVPRSASPPGCLRVPCLGGLDAGTIAAWSTHAGGVEILDRGWCRNCPAGGTEPPVREALTEARQALREAGEEAHRLPAIQESPLPEDQAADPLIPPPMAERTMSRRAFFGRLAGEAASLSSAPADARTETHGDTPSTHSGNPPTPPRHRLVRVVLERTPQLPAPLAPGLTIDPAACCNHQICASLCPTGALYPVSGQAGSGLDFDPARCIGCEFCQRVCPERALTLHASQGAAGPVIRRQHRQCGDCLQPFAGGGGSAGALCPNCEKKYGLLAGEGRELLFGRRSGPAVHPDPSSRQATAPGGVYREDHSMTGGDTS